MEKKNIQISQRKWMTWNKDCINLENGQKTNKRK